MLRLLNDPAFLRFVGDRGVRTEADAVEYILRGPVASYERLGYGMYVIELAERAVPIGICGLVKREQLEEPDLGYALDPDYRGSGYAREAAGAVMDHARHSLGLRRLFAIVSPENLPSLRVLEEIGFEFDALRPLFPREAEIAVYQAAL